MVKFNFITRRDLQPMFFFAALPYAVGIPGIILLLSVVVTVVAASSKLLNSRIYFQQNRRAVTAKT